MKEHPYNSSLLSFPSDPARFWQEMVAETDDKPWLLRLLGKQGAVLYLRFRNTYQQLLQLRPGQLRRIQSKLGVSLAGAAFLLALGSGPVASSPQAGITVDAGGNCTLAEAITSANNDYAAGNGCVDGSGADTITLQTNVSLTSALPDIDSVITIEGDGNTIQRTSGGEFSVLRVTPDGNLTLNNATISGGSTSLNGGGIYNGRNGTVTVQNSIVSGNSAYSGGGIFNYGFLTVQNNSTISGNSASTGGGISNFGGLTVMNSTISGNSGSNGGGIFTSDGWVVLYSTISGNTVSVEGGGIYSTFAGFGSILYSTVNGNSAYIGGGFSNHGGNTVTRCTFYDNSASSGGGISNQNPLMVEFSTLFGNSASSGGGISNSDSGDVKVWNSTLSGNSASNGGGIYNNSSKKVTVQNSIVANQSAGEDCANFATLTSDGYNIESGTSCGFSETGDLQNVNPLLGPLADNGGSTKTHALLNDSPAIDAAPSESCTGHDQRGMPRYQDGDGTASIYECDIGAVETMAFSASLINDGADVIFNWSGVDLHSYQLWRSTNPHDNYVLFQDNLTGNSTSTTVHAGTNYYYELRGLLIDGTTVHISRHIGVFSFALVPISS